MIQKQVPIKVNAWVDEGIKPLVEALNTLPDIVTVDSCQGIPNREFAYVYFQYHGNENNTYSFVKELSTSLGAHVPADNEYAIRIQWTAGAEFPLIMLTTQPEFIESLSQALLVQNELVASV